MIQHDCGQGSPILINNHYINWYPPFFTSLFLNARCENSREQSVYTQSILITLRNKKKSPNKPHRTSVWGKITKKNFIKFICSLTHLRPLCLVFLSSSSNLYWTLLIFHIKIALWFSQVLNKQCTEAEDNTTTIIFIIVAWL